MSAKTATTTKSPEEIALEKLRDSLSKLSAEAFYAKAEVYTHGHKLGSVIVINSVNAIMVRAIEDVQALRAELPREVPSSAPAQTEDQNAA